MIAPSFLLRRALQADTLFSGVSALLLTFAAGPLASLLNLPDMLLRGSGIFLIGYVAMLIWIVTRAEIIKPVIWLVIIGNAAWTMASIALLFSGAVAPNLLGSVMIAAQAIVVGVFAELQYLGLRRSSAAAGTAAI